MMVLEPQNIEQEMSNFEVQFSLLRFDISCSIFEISNIFGQDYRLGFGLVAWHKSQFLPPRRQDTKQPRCLGGSASTTRATSAKTFDLQAHSS
jgi:hypothetical protein